MPSAPLRDAHLHIAAFGEEMSCASASACASIAECLELVAQAAADTPRPRWIKIVGASVETWRERAWPTAAQLSAAAAGRPVVLCSFDHHAMVVSEGVLAAAGITADTPDPPRGLIAHDPATGAPTGLLLEEACRLVYAVMPAPDDDQFRQSVRRALDHLTRAGYVELHDMLATPQLARVLLDFEREGSLNTTIWLYATREHFDALADAVPTWQSNRVRLAGLKLFTDGTLNSRTAAMLHPFADPLPGHPRGKALMSTREIADAVRHADVRGYPIAAHAIGDAAVRACLDAIELVRPASRAQRIEHAQFIDEADIPRFEQLNVVASMQPAHLLTDIPAIRRLTPNRAHRAFPLRDLVDAAHAAGRNPRDLVWLGSDAPIVPPEWNDTRQAAAFRRPAGAAESQSLAPEQAIPDDLALALMRAT